MRTAATPPASRALANIYLKAFSAIFHPFPCLPGKEWGTDFRDLFQFVTELLGRLRLGGYAPEYVPNFTRIDLATGTMPKKDQKEVIFCCAGSFTGQLLTEFNHSNIAGDHVSGGTYYKGYKCGPYNGVFTWSRTSGWKFFNHAYENAKAPLQKAATEGGMGYCQTMLYSNGKRFPGCFKPGAVNRYRALCQIGKRLCIVDCARPLPFGHFLDGLQKLGVSNALYCDMGKGWNYSWYRQNDGTVKELFPTPGRYTTNWITFYTD